jgi:hypothetical protein
MNPYPIFCLNILPRLDQPEISQPALVDRKLEPISQLLDDFLDRFAAGLVPKRSL